jgi:hypothetical protein
MFFGINEAFHFSTDGDDFNTVNDGKEEFVLGKVETVHVLSKENRVLILTRDPQTMDYLYGFDLEGQLLFKVEPPEHFHFWYLSGKQVACTEADDQAKKSPLSGWWFSIDLENGNMEMRSPAY